MALSDINKNIIIGPPANPYDANGFQGKKPIPSKKPLVPVRRPVNRTSAQIACKPSLPLPDGKKPKIHTIPDDVESEIQDYNIIDVEDDFNAPMFVQHTETMLEEIDKMDEDVYEEPLLDIDSHDKGNPLAVVEYIDDIYAHYRKQEMICFVSPGYMSKQNDITDRMRGILVDWLIEVHYKFELMEETLYLTVNLIDRFLERETVSRKKLQLVGTSMLLACKYEEISVPVVEDFILVTLPIIRFSFVVNTFVKHCVGTFVKQCWYVLLLNNVLVLLSNIVGYFGLIDTVYLKLQYRIQIVLYTGFGISYFGIVFLKPAFVF